MLWWRLDIPILYITYLLIQNLGERIKFFTFLENELFSEIDFSVVVVDCEPEFNGRKMVSKLEGKKC